LKIGEDITERLSTSCVVSCFDEGGQLLTVAQHTHEKGKQHEDRYYEQPIKIGLR
jgi:hypothetical protein